MEKFDASFESLRTHNYPDWFRNAKFGIWSHWGPQSVPMYGDWYARNMYIEGGVVYAISAGGAEVALDANTEGGAKLYVNGGTLFAIGGLENGASLGQTCYQASSWSKNTWYGLTVGDTTYAFKTPSSGGNGLVVSGSSEPSLLSGVSVSGGTSAFNGMAAFDASVSGGSSVSLSAYSGGSGMGGPGGGGMGGPGGGFPGGH